VAGLINSDGVNDKRSVFSSSYSAVQSHSYWWVIFVLPIDLESEKLQIAHPLVIVNFSVIGIVRQDFFVWKIGQHGDCAHAAIHSDFAIW